MLNRPHSSLIMKYKGGSTAAAALISITTYKITNGLGLSSFELSSK